jgi:Dolichyl-phosphate-mannose-protein mannosyltransferase
MPALKKVFLHLLIIFCFVGFIIAIRFKPITQSFELDYDEGLNLIKALLYSQGFSLYTQIWNDQPPIFTVLLSLWFSLFGQSVFAARFLVLLFSGLLIWCFYQIINSELGKIPAFTATLLLLTSWLFIRLSISVMIGIPSLSLAMLSIYLLTLYKKYFSKRFLIFSGFFIALSLQTKLFTVLLIPVMLFYLVDFKLKIFQIRQQKHVNFAKSPQAEAWGYTNKAHLSGLNKAGFVVAAPLQGIAPKLRYSQLQQRFLYLEPIFVWLSTLSITYILIGLFYQQFSNFNQILQSHLYQPKSATLANFNNIEYLPYMMSQDYEYIVLALIGILAIFWKKQRNGLFPLTWLGIAILFLLNHKPIWYHHYPLVAIPICWLSAYAVALMRDRFLKDWHYNFDSLHIKKLIIPCFASIFLIIIMVVTPANPKGKPPKNLEVMQLVAKHKDSTQWIFTDRPIYAFYAGLRVPPEMAVMSYKRLNSGDLTSKELLAILQSYHPEQIVLARWTSQIKNDTNLITYINENYSKTYGDEKGTVEHYLRK